MTNPALPLPKDPPFQNDADDRAAPQDTGLMPIFPPAVLPGMASPAAAPAADLPEVVATADELHAIYKLASGAASPSPAPAAPTPSAPVTSAPVAAPQAPPPAARAVTQAQSSPARTAPAPISAASPAPTPAASQQPVFLADTPAGLQSATGAYGQLAPIVELLAHRGASTPLSVGLFGRAGSGSTSAARSLADAVGALAQRATGTSPFLSRLILAQVEAAEIAEAPAQGLARAIWDTLLAEGTPAAIALARHAAHSLHDPVSAAREAHDKVAELRRQLDAERAALDDITSRRGRLADALLYDTAGSRVDSHARTNRARIDGQMRRFGFKTDTVLSWKDLVAHTFERGTAARPFAVLRSLWAYAGQTTLIITGLVLITLSWGLGQAQATQGSWLAWLRAQGTDQLTSLAAILEANMSWFATLGTATFVLGLAAFALNIWRALTFQQSLWRGSALLAHDIAERRAVLDATIGHLTKRIDQFSADLQKASDEAAHADRRKADAASGNRTMGGSMDALPFPLDSDSGGTQELAARRYLAAIAERLASAPAGGPQRLIVTLDGLGILDPVAAAQLAARVRQMLDLPGLALVIVGDGGRLARGFGLMDPASADAALSRLIQVPVHLDAAGHQTSPDFVQALLGGGGSLTPSGSLADRMDPRAARLDQPLSKAEQAILAGLSKALLTTPRHVKRFLNLYRLARCGMNGLATITPPRLGDLSGLALSMALDIGGTGAERQAYLSALASLGEEQVLAFDRTAPRLRDALAVIADLCGALHGAEARAGFEQALTFSLPRMEA